MTNQLFEASNGYEIEEEGGELLVYDKHGILYTNISEPLGDALCEYFKHERDQQLGRTRWPENPDYVIYRAEENDDEDGRCVCVLHELSPNIELVWERWAAEPISTSVAAARWYFTEGPGKPERPWEKAEPGEVWRLTVEGREGNALVKEAPSGNLYFYSIKDTTPLRYAGITAGRKLLNADGSVADD